MISLQDELARTKVTASDATTSTVQLDELAARGDGAALSCSRAISSATATRSRAPTRARRCPTCASSPPRRRPVTPASPKVSLILAAVAFVALALQVGGIIFGELMSGRALVTRAEDIDDEYQPAAAYRPHRSGSCSPLSINERTASADEPTTIDDIVAASQLDAAVVARDAARARARSRGSTPFPRRQLRPTAAAAEPAPETPAGGDRGRPREVEEQEEARQ